MSLVAMWASCRMAGTEVLATKLERARMLELVKMELMRVLLMRRHRCPRRLASCRGAGTG